MDFKFKARPWVENLCLKFENICQEVEGMVCKEAKHVEDQVQAVGANVNKFFTEVAQDFLSPSSMDLAKQTNPNGCVEEKTTKENQSDVKMELILSEGNNSPRKPTSNETCEARNLVPPSFVNLLKEAGVESLLDKSSSPKDDGWEEDAFEGSKEDKIPAPGFAETISLVESQTSILSCPSSNNHSDPLSSGDPAKESDSEKFCLSLEECEDCGLCQNTGDGVEETPTHEELQFPDVADVACLGESDCEASLSNNNSLNKDNVEDVGENMSKISASASEKVVGITSSQDSETVFVNCTNSANISSSLPLLEGTDPVRSGLCRENKVDNTGLPLSCTKSYGSPRVPDVFSLLGSSSNSSKKWSELVEPEAFVSTTQVDNSDAELAEHYGSNPVMNINEFDDVKLADSCLVVDAKELLSLSSRVRNHRSYTKKIRDAFASRIGSRKQKEYKQLAIWYGDMNSEIRTVRTEGSVPSMLTKQKVSKHFSVHHSYESDWVLL